MDAEQAARSVAVPERLRSPALAAQISLIASSYHRLLGRKLVTALDDPVEALWSLPMAVVAHGPQEDPLFFFANAAELQAFETDLDGFCGMPSRLSAEAPERAERQALLDRVASAGFIDDYRGVRISARGHRFVIGPATVWNLVDVQGVVHGQAACFAP